MGHVLALLTDPYTGGGAMQGAAPGIGVANRLWLFTDKLPFKVQVTAVVTFCGNAVCKGGGGCELFNYFLVCSRK